MSAAILPAPPATDTLRRKRFTRSEVDRMQNLGFFDGQRCEFIEGELFDKMGQNPTHAQAIQNILFLLAQIFGLRQIRTQLPIEAVGPDQDRNLPEPDVTVLKESNSYGKRHPRGDETILIVEVADASLRQDLTVKPSLYARADVPEYWVLDLPSRRLIVHRQPSSGEYAQVVSLTEADSVGCATRPDQSITVRDFLP